MNVFELQRMVIKDYEAYVRSFISIRDAHVREKIDADLAAGLLWPEPRIALNPALAEGAWIDDFVAQGVLHPECAKIIRVKTDSHDTGQGLRLHQHQVDALHGARAGREYVVTRRHRLAQEPLSRRVACQSVDAQARVRPPDRSACGGA